MSSDKGERVHSGSTGEVMRWGLPDKGAEEGGVGDCESVLPSLEE